MVGHSLLRAFMIGRKGSSAVEFAIVAPCLLMMVMGTVAFAAVLTIHHGVQQLAAEAARAAVAGLSSSEYDSLARDFVADHAGAYAFLDPAALTVSTSVDPGPSAALTVSLRYDMSALFVFRLGSLLPLPAPVVLRSAVVQRGGY